MKLFGKKKNQARKDGFLESAECGMFTLDFYYDGENPENCKIEVRCGVQMSFVLNASHEGYGFLMSCYYDKAKDAMEAYCGMLWQCSYLLAMDSYFPKRVQQSWQRYMRFLEKNAETAAKAVTNEQNEADEALMNEAVRVADMPEDERKAMTDKILNELKEKAND